MSTAGTETESHLESSMRLEAGQSTPPRSPSPQITRTFPRNATIVLVGSRGSGKRSLGFIGATHLGRRLITEDHYFEEVTGLSRKEFLSRYGNKEFCKRNVEVLRRMLENEWNCIIECGMGSLARETQAVLRDYSKAHPVVHILRNSDRIRRLLNLSEAWSKRLEYADSVHHSCSNFEYYNLHDPSCEQHLTETPQDRGSPSYSSGLKDAKQDFSNFLDFITGNGLEKSAFESRFSLAATPPEHRAYTFALSLKLSDLVQENVDLSQLDPGGDAIELRIDAWFPSIRIVVDKQVAQLRRKIGVPIILYVENGISDEEETVLTLLHHGLRLGVDYLVVSLKLRDDSIRKLVQAKGGTKIIGEYTEENPGASSWLDVSRIAMYQRARWVGCDIVRLLQEALSKRDNDDVRNFLDKAAEISQTQLPLIAYNLGTLGHPSLISNRIFTPVTHPAVKSKTNEPRDFLVAAQEATQALYQTSIFDPLHFYVFGAAVSYSLSPIMHNAAYRVRGMSHDFQIRQASTLDELHRISQDPHFGGAAISQPFKVGCMPHLHASSHHAKAIGAVNTILPLRAIGDGSHQFLLQQANLRNHAGPVLGWYGDNTDFIGIMTCLRRNASPRNVVQPSKTTGLVIGAGGMARAAIYAMIQLGCRKIFVYNRTMANAQKVANHFNSWAAALSNRGSVVSVLKSGNEPWPAEFRPPTLIVSCVPAHKVGSQPAADFQMPVQWLGSSSGGVVLEASDSHYLPDYLTSRGYPSILENFIE
jgi:3-dehydroquinate dehydratase type I